MSWYGILKKEWKDIITTVSNEIKRDVVMVEKDTIQSMFLFELSKHDFPFVFKGGTSLSKVFGLIERFSEDIDISLSKNIPTFLKKNIKSVILDVAKSLGLTVSNLENIKSRYDYNKYIFEYESLFYNKKLEIIIETSFYYEVYPVQKQKVNNFISEFCIKKNIILPIPFDGSNFEFCVQSLERTLIDKVFALCDYKLENMLDRDSRHLYDIAKIVPHVEFNNHFAKMVIEVRKDRMLAKNNPSAQPQYNIQTILREIIETRFFEPDYKNLTSKLLYEDFSYEKAIDEGIRLILDKNIF